MPKRKELKPISYENGKKIINANCTQANDNFARAVRLQEQAEGGDEEAARALQKMENTDMFQYKRGNE